MVAHAGLRVLGEFCDAVGLGEALSRALPYQGPGEAVYDRGAMLVQMMLVTAGGGEACSDIEVLRSESEVFGDVPATSTVHRTLSAMTADQVKATAAGMAEVRRRVWKMMGITPDAKEGLTLDIDASVHVVHSENKEGAAPNYKGLRVSSVVLHTPTPQGRC